jgi:hypothetical protein
MCNRRGELVVREAELLAAHQPSHGLRLLAFAIATYIGRIFQSFLNPASLPETGISVMEGYVNFLILLRPMLLKRAIKEMTGLGGGLPFLS